MDAKRGFVPEDEKYFSQDSIEKMITASGHVCYLLNEGYGLKQATTFVCDHFLSPYEKGSIRPEYPPEWIPIGNQPLTAPIITPFSKYF